MARSIWTGTIQFGLVAAPVQLTVAVRERSIHFHMMTPDGECRLRRKLVCPETGKEYDFKDTARGYEVGPEEYVLIDEGELRKLKPEAGKTIDILDFVQIDQIDPVFYNHTYYVRPTEAGKKSFALLLAAMEHKQRAAIAKFVLRDRQHLVTLRPYGPIMALHTMFYADEVQKSEEIAPSRMPKASSKELAIAEQLIGMMAGDFKPEKYHDEHRRKMKQVLEAKAKGRAIHVPAPKHPEKISNLMEALEQSLAAAGRTSRNGHGRNGQAHSPRGVRRRRGGKGKSHGTLRDRGARHPGHTLLALRYLP